MGASPRPVTLAADDSGAHRRAEIRGGRGIPTSFEATLVTLDDLAAMEEYAKDLEHLLVRQIARAETLKRSLVTDLEALRTKHRHLRQR